MPATGAAGADRTIGAAGSASADRTIGAAGSASAVRSSGSVWERRRSVGPSSLRRAYRGARRSARTGLALPSESHRNGGRIRSPLARAPRILAEASARALGRTQASGAGLVWRLYAPLGSLASRDPFH